MLVLLVMLIVLLLMVLPASRWGMARLALHAPAPVSCSSSRIRQRGRGERRPSREIVAHGSPALVAETRPGSSPAPAPVVVDRDKSDTSMLSTTAAPIATTAMAVSMTMTMRVLPVMPRDGGLLRHCGLRLTSPLAAEAALATRRPRRRGCRVVPHADRIKVIRCSLGAQLLRIARGARPRLAPAALLPVPLPFPFPVPLPVPLSPPALAVRQTGLVQASASTSTSTTSTSVHTLAVLPAPERLHQPAGVLGHGRFRSGATHTIRTSSG